MTILFVCILHEIAGLEPFLEKQRNEWSWSDKNQIQLTHCANKRAHEYGVNLKLARTFLVNWSPYFNPITETNSSQYCCAYYRLFMFNPTLLRYSNMLLKTL